MIKHTFLAVLICCCFLVKGQNPSNITISTVPPNYSTDTYTRAVTSINLLPGFKYGPSTGATNLINLNISSHPAYVNNNYVNPASVQNYYSFNSGLEASVINGSGKVDPMGAFNYNLPIYCSPGTAGIEPQLSIAYNSNGANNWLGLGFNLAGISSITRSGKSVFYDGINSGVNFTSNDVFALDGSRLLIKSGVYGQNNSTYKLEVENYHTVTSVGTQGSGPQYFIVTTPEGMTIEYGKTGNSQSVDKTNTEVLAWYVSKVYDVFGNYMTFTYNNSNGELLIEKIEYTGNGSLNPYNKIEFSYTERSDKNSFYIAGKEFSRKHILKSIACTDINGSLVRKYLFEYQYEYASLLSKITMIDANGNSLNPTYFKWRQDQKSPAYFVCSPLTFNQAFSSKPEFEISVPADLNGDGITDILLLRNISAFEAQAKINNGLTTLCQLVPNAPIDFTVQPGILSLSSPSVQYITSFAFDEDDDNIDEVFVVYSPAASAGITYEIKKIKNTGGSLTASTVHSGTIPGGIISTWFPLQIFNNHSRLFNRSSYFYAKEDITGDNLRDVIITDQNNLVVIPSNGQSLITIPLTNIIKTQLGDFDGNGVLDIYVLKAPNLFNPPYTLDVYKYNSGNALSIVSSISINTGSNPNMASWASYNNSTVLNNYANGNKSVDFGDIDGDGKADIFYLNYLNSSTGEVHVLRSDGVSFLPDNNPLAIPLLLNGYEANLFSADINNDGYSDLALSSSDYITEKSNFNYYPSNGNMLTPAAGLQTYSDAKLGALDDFNGDGALDYIHQSGFSHFEVTFNMFNQNNKKQVQQISSIQEDIKITYNFLSGEKIMGTLNNTGRFYLRTSPVNNSSSFSQTKPDLFVVTSTVANDHLLKYAYVNGVYHRTGKGFLGFEKIITSDKNTQFVNAGIPENKGVVTTFTFDPVFDDVTGTESIEAFLPEPDLFIVNSLKIASSGKTQSNYTQTGTNRFLNSSIALSRNYLSSTSSRQTITYDNLSGGLIKSSLSENLTWTGQLINSVKQDLTYTNLINQINSSSYFRVQQNTELRSSGTAATSYIHTFAYNPQGNLVSSVKNSNLSSLAVTTSYSQFTPFGQAKSIVITAPDLPQPRSSSVQFDATGRFVIQSANSLGNTESALYEPKYGNVIETTDITGLVTKNTYDGSGRLVKSISPTGAVITQKYEWYSYTLPSPSSAQAYGIKATHEDEATGSSITLFDRNGNMLRNESPGFGGSTIITENTFDVRNRKLSSSSPHFSTQSGFKGVFYVYDEFDRLKNIHETLAQSILNTLTYSYNSPSTDGNYIKGFVKAQSPAGAGNLLFNIKENNEAGQIDKIVNYSNVSAQHVANYTYNQHQAPVQVVTSFPGGSGGATTSFGYDALGRQSQINDPSAGIFQYNINSIGELTSQMGPNGNYIYTYDQLGRLDTKTGSGTGTYNYEYVTSGNGLLNLKKVTGPTVITEYTYDNFNRLGEKKETVAGSPAKIFKTAYSYDKFHRLKDYTYPGGFKTTHEYEASGTLSKIKNNSTTIWELTEMHTPQLIKKYNNTAGITTHMSYDNNFNLQQMNLGSISSQNITINNTTSNIGSRTHQNLVSGASNNEGFVYDDFDRLIKTTFQDPSNTTLTKHVYTYKNNGNLEYKDDCGDYVYGNPSKPYQLTQIQNATNNVSLNTLNISYTDFNKVNQISESTSNKQFDFVYGNYYDRIKMDYKIGGATQYTRYYQDNYDRQETGSGFKEWSYIYSPTGLAAVYVNSNGTGELLNLTLDHLGSPLLLTNVGGQIEEEYSFDAWGRRRNPNDWTYSGLTAPQKMIRGYTMHEHLDELGLINMNGRIYDPVLGRFIQPDSYIQDPGNLQNMNRYSYVMNNPVKYTDPSGYETIGPGNGGIPPDPNWNHNEHLNAPVLFVDGVRIEPGGGGYGFFLGGGGGGGGLSTHYYAPGGGGGTHVFNYAALANSSLSNYNIPGMGNIGLLSSNQQNNAFGNVFEEDFQFVGGITLPEVLITKYRDGRFGKPSYDIWGLINNRFTLEEGLFNAKYRNPNDDATDGNFNGVPVFVLPGMSKGKAFTLPNAIFISAEDKTNIHLLRHEFGHYIYAQLKGNLAWYMMAQESVYSTMQDYWHQTTWTEWQANYLSYIYFNKPNDWKFERFPITPRDRTNPQSFPKYK